MRPLSDSQRETMEEATALYEAALTRDAARYLTGRGLEPETIATFRLGSVVEAAPGHAQHRGRISIPYLSKDGHPLQVRFRCFQEHDHRELHHGKYNTVSGEPSRLFNVQAFGQATDTIHLTEGEFDAMILAQIGLPAIAVPGSQNWKPHYRRMLAGFNRVYVWADPDDAGAELVNTVSKALFQAKPVRLRDGDVSDTYLAGGQEALLDLIGEK